MAFVHLNISSGDICTQSHFQEDTRKTSQVSIPKSRKSSLRAASLQGLVSTNCCAVWESVNQIFARTRCSQSGMIKNSVYFLRWVDVFTSNPWFIFEGFCESLLPAWWKVFLFCESAVWWQDTVNFTLISIEKIQSFLVFNGYTFQDNREYSIRHKFHIFIVLTSNTRMDECFDIQVRSYTICNGTMMCKIQNGYETSAHKKSAAKFVQDCIIHCHQLNFYPRSRSLTEKFSVQKLLSSIIALQSQLRSWYKSLWNVFGNECLSNMLSISIKCSNVSW